MLLGKKKQKQKTEFLFSVLSPLSSGVNNNQAFA